MSDSAHTVWALQRVALMRARRVIFSGILDLGGPPTSVEEERQLAEDTRMAEVLTADLRDVLANAAPGGFFAGSFDAQHRDYWSARVPALLSFGARTHGELVRLAPRTRSERNATRAAALFQLAASLLDWSGDEDGGASDVIHRLPVSALECMVRDARERNAVVARVQHDGRPTTATFVALLSVLIEIVHRLDGDTNRFFDELAVAYGAELASFTPPSSAGGRLELARLKSSAPTAVIGELARLAATGDEMGVVAQAVSAIAGIFGTIDDVADLSDDLRKGAVNTLADAADIRATADDDGVASALRTVLATDLIEERSSTVANDVRELARRLEAAHVDPASSARALEWLRTTTWRWIA